MRRIYFLLASALIFILAASNSSYAQDEPKGHLYTVTTWKFSIPQDGSPAELDSLLKVYQDKVVVKNDKIISQKVWRHYWGADLRDWVVVSEFATWDDIEAAGDEGNKLSKEAWPDKADRQKFYKAFFKYVVTHSDEIYMDQPDLAK